MKDVLNCTPALTE